MGKACGRSIPVGRMIRQKVEGHSEAHFSLASFILLEGEGSLGVKVEMISWRPFVETLSWRPFHGGPFVEALS